MSGARMSLVSNDVIDRYLQSILSSPNRYKSNHEEHIIPNTGSTRLNYTILRDCDAYQFEYLIIKCPNIPSTYQEIIDKLNTFQLIIGGIAIWLNKINLFTQLEKPKIIGNNICIKLPYDMFVDDIKIISAINHTISLQLDLNEPMHYYEFSLRCNKIYYDLETQRHYVQNSITTIVQQIQSHIVELPQPVTEFNQHLNFTGLSKGYLLEGNIDDIVIFKLNINDINYVEYNNVMLQLYSVKISDKLYFLPFHPNEDKTPESFVAGLNHSRINITCHIIFANPQTNISIHSICFNVLQYDSGMCCTRFCYSQQDIPDIIRVASTTQNYTIRNNIIHWITKNKIIDISRNIECPITYKTFDVNCSYCECDACNYNFDTCALKESFEISDRKTCPMCRSSWNNFIIYVNKEDIIE